MKKKYFGLIIFIIVMFGCSSNQVLKTRELGIKIENSENLNSYQKDFIYLIKVLKDSHPNIYENFSKDAFNAEKGKLLTEFQNLNNETEYQIKLQQFVAKIGDAHTKVFISNLYKTESQYPIHYKWLKNKLYILDTGKSLSEKLIGARIIKINKLTVNETIDLGGSIISCENEIWKKTQLQQLFSNPVFLKLMDIADSADSLSLTILSDQIEKTVTLYPQKKVKWRKLLPCNKITAKKKNKPHSYQIFPEEKTCYYQFNKFFDRQTLKSFIKDNLRWYLHPIAYSLTYIFFPNYENFLEKMFNDMKRNDVNKIIIDLRYNSGGNSSLGDLFMYHCNIPDTIKGFSVPEIKLSELLKDTYKGTFNSLKQYYLKENPDQDFKLPVLVKLKSNQSDNKKSYFSDLENGYSNWKIKQIEEKFTGKIILLIGSDTFSSASDFATTMSDNKLATLIGEPIGQKPTSFGDILLFRLPETKTMIAVSFKVFQRPDSSKDNEPTLYPDIGVYPTIDDLLEGKDPVFEKAMKL